MAWLYVVLSRFIRGRLQDDSSLHKQFQDPVRIGRFSGMRVPGPSLFRACEHHDSDDVDHWHSRMGGPSRDHLRRVIKMRARKKTWPQA